MGKRKNSKNNLKSTIIGIIFLILISILEYFNPNILENVDASNGNEIQETTSYNLSEIPEYEESPYVIINNNLPYFDQEDYTTKSFETYSKLDQYGRCGVAFANISKETMPPEGDERESINSVDPTGWKQKMYNGSYLYNRCHLIGYQLSDEDANKLNLITGTRYFNVSGMLPFENQVAEYLRENEDNHVLYRVTPIFEDSNLLATRSTNGSLFCRR